MPTAHPSVHDDRGRATVDQWDEESIRALWHSEQRFRRAAETVPDILFITDENAGTVYINSRYSEYTGLSARSAEGRGWIRALHPEEVADILENWRRGVKTGSRVEMRHRLRMADGTYRWFITRSRPVRDDDGRITYWYGTSTDIDDLIRAEEEIIALNTSLEQRVRERTEQVRALSSALTLAEQRERKRVTYFLHDDVQQQLYGIKLKADLLSRDVANGPLRERMTELAQSLDDAIHSVRSLAIEISPPVLRGEGLDIGLEWLASHVEERYGLRVDVTISKTCSIPHEDQRMLLYQIIRELLFNVIKHAGVDRAEVSVERHDDRLCTQVADEGIGFDVAKMEAASEPDTFGLVSIRERLALFGGSLQVESEPGSGTRMTIITPVDLEGASASPR